MAVKLEAIKEGAALYEAFLRATTRATDEGGPVWAIAAELRQWREWCAAYGATLEERSKARYMAELAVEGL